MTGAREYLAALEEAVAQCPDDDALRARIATLPGGAAGLVRFLEEGMPRAYRAERAAGAAGVVRLDVDTGDRVAEVRLEVDGSGCRARSAGEPDTVVSIPLPVLLRIAFKQLSGPDAYVDGSVSATGDVVLAAAFDDWFEPLSAVAAESVA